MFFIKKKVLVKLVEEVAQLRDGVDYVQNRIKGLKAEVSFMHRVAEEESLARQYTRGIPLIEVVRALVKETGKEPEIISEVPAKVVLSVRAPTSTDEDTT